MGDEVTTIRVLIAEDEQLVRGGIVMLLACEADIDVVGEAATGDAAVSLARELRPDVVLMDLSMPGMDGVEATRLLTAGPDADQLLKVLVLTTFDGDEAVYGALRAGASGYLTKLAAPLKLAEAIRTVAAGDSWIDSAVADKVIQVLRGIPHVSSSPSTVIERLTPREREVLVLMAQGYSNSEISHRFVLSEATVKTHVARVIMKTGSRDRTQAVVLAYQSGLVVPPG